MKSLLISHLYFPPQVGGIARFMESLAAALGPDRVCCLTGRPPVPGFADPIGGPRVYRSPTAFAGSLKVARAAAWATTAGTIIIRERPRAVLLGTVYDGKYGDWMRRWLGLPYVAFAYGNEILGILKEEGRTGELSPVGNLLRSANGMVAVSHYTAGLLRRAGVQPDRIDIVYPGCDANRFSARPPDIDLKQRLLGTRSRDRVILTTGNLVARKGHDMVLRALPGVCARLPDVTYIVVGDGPCRADLESLAASLGVRDRVVFAGRVADDQLPELYALADVFIMASRDREDECDVEGFGMVYLEAGACGKPVVGGRAGGVPEAIVDGTTGFLVDPSDPEDIAGALVRVLNDRQLAGRMGEQGRARVLRDFAWSGVADRIDGILTAAAGRERRSGP